MKDPFRYLDNKKRASMELILIAEDEEQLEELRINIVYALTKMNLPEEIIVANYEVMDNECE